MWPSCTNTRTTGPNHEQGAAIYLSNEDGSDVDRGERKPRTRSKRSMLWAIRTIATRDQNALEVVRRGLDWSRNRERRDDPELSIAARVRRRWKW